MKIVIHKSNCRSLADRNGKPFEYAIVITENGLDLDDCYWLGVCTTRKDAKNKAKEYLKLSKQQLENIVQGD